MTYTLHMLFENLKFIDVSIGMIDGFNTFVKATPSRL